MTTLFNPLKVGALTVPNRIFMAPLTRCRASAEHVPNAMMAEYYAERAWNPITGAPSPDRLAVLGIEVGATSFLGYTTG